jgi:hypothetical protein
MICPPVGTTDGAICLLLAPFCLHRGHHAGVVPALAHVLLVRRVTSVLAAVVAAELLTWLDLTSAPHVLAVHPTSHPSPARRRKTSLSVHLVCVPRAASTSPGSPDRSPGVFTRHLLGPPTGHRRAARVDAANVAPSVPIPSSLGTRAARPA